MKKKTKLVNGWGVNDVNYPVQKFSKIDGKRTLAYICPYYEKWKQMVRRVYSEQFKKKRPSYHGASIWEGWKYLSKFIEWVDSQPNRNWQNCDLDKDLMSGCDKIYSPDTCCFVTKQVNIFLKSSGIRRGPCRIGVSYRKRDRKYQSKCNNPFTAKEVYLGYFESEQEAYSAYLKQKHIYACMLADLESDQKVADALRTKFDPNIIVSRDTDKNITNNL